MYGKGVAPQLRLGLFVMESFKVGGRITIYSGKDLDRLHVVVPVVHTLFTQISESVFLDAQDDTFGLGKFINCDRKARDAVLQL